MAPKATDTTTNVAVTAAISQLGKPYIWATPADAADPNPKSFDCSGLTMWCWHKAGIKLDHYTVTQYTQTKHRPLADAQPGDLVFFNDGGIIHHVALYVGSSKIIEAPTPGIPVRYRDISPSSTGIMKNVGIYTGAAGAFDGTQLAANASTGVSSSSSSTLGDNLLSGSFWRRVGLGALGAGLIIAAVKMGI